MFLVVSRLDLHYGSNRPFFARPKSRVPRKKFAHPLLLLLSLLLLLLLLLLFIFYFQLTS